VEEVVLAYVDVLIQYLPVGNAKLHKSFSQGATFQSIESNSEHPEYETGFLTNQQPH
jgi:hypothetical protein